MASMAATICVLAFVLSLFVQGSFGKIECENLNEKSCAYAVSSTGKRCVLEKRVHYWGGAEEYTCRASEIEADKVIKDWIESDECIKACGVDRSALGISSDSLLESRFVKMLCSNACYRNCPNIVDLYFNLAAGEGVYLPKFCEAQQQRKDNRREMAEIRSSGDVAAGAPESPRAVGLFADGPSSMAPIMAPF